MRINRVVRVEEGHIGWKIEISISLLKYVHFDDATFADNITPDWISLTKEINPLTTI
jgi:hypothetical protein